MYVHVSLLQQQQQTEKKYKKNRLVVLSFLFFNVSVLFVLLAGSYSRHTGYNGLCVLPFSCRLMDMYSPDGSRHSLFFLFSLLLFLYYCHFLFPT
jgi:hypothetical protein